MKPVVYTIGRQYGSLGRKIGMCLAQKLDIPFYDNELITLAAQKSGVSPEIFEAVDEKPTNSFLYSLAMGALNTNSVIGYQELSVNDKLFLAQCQVIEDAVKEGSCVFVGRCADYVLRDYENTVNVFVYGDVEKRMERIEALRKLSRQKAIEAVHKKDRGTANFYNYYTNRKWGAKETYDLMLCTDHLSAEAAADVIIYFAQLMKKAGK